MGSRSEIACKTLICIYTTKRHESTSLFDGRYPEALSLLACGLLIVVSNVKVSVQDVAK